MPPSRAKLFAFSVNCFIFSFSARVSSSPRARMASISASVRLVGSELNTISAPYRTMFIRSSLPTLFWELSVRRPCWITSASRRSFLYAFSMTFSSMEFSMHKRNTCTSFFCPMRCARSMACKSICGFQSLSYSTKWFAPMRLRPAPPARVDNRKTCPCPLLNASTLLWRSSTPTEPSMRFTDKPLGCSSSFCMQSRALVDVDTITARSLLAMMASSSPSSTRILPEASLSPCPRCIPAGSHTRLLVLLGISSAAACLGGPEMETSVSSEVSDNS
mmetsp:Transcript_9560/g.24432  ORF Transcript_9560/g.24432 Transcript_9560/m.24432 type:complete len:275 (+) Transcript_9560:1666-2490(+)